MDFVDRLEAMGSTDINRAVIEALGLAEEDACPPPSSS